MFLFTRYIQDIQQNRTKLVKFAMFEVVIFHKFVVQGLIIFKSPIMPKNKLGTS